MLIILWHLCLLALACRSKVLARLSRRFRGPADALKFFESPPESRSLPSPRPVLHHRDASTQAGLCAGDISTQMKTLLGTLPQSEQAGVVCDLMQSLAPPAVTVPPEFIAQSLTSMQRLQATLLKPSTFVLCSIGGERAMREGLVSYRGTGLTTTCLTTFWMS